MYIILFLVLIAGYWYFMDWYGSLPYTGVIKEKYIWLFEITQVFVIFGVIVVPYAVVHYIWLFNNGN